MEAERLYGLALALVPDEDAAGDLLMVSRDEADLRKRSASWRAAHGLGPAPHDPAPVELTAEQAQHAYHLARRRALRLRLQRLAWTGGGVAAALLVLVFALRLYAGTPRPGHHPAEGWEQSEVFTGAPIARSDRVAGLQLEIFRLDATPDTVTAYWAITASDAAARSLTAAAEVDPVLIIGASEPTYSSHIQRIPAGRNRLVGRSTFQVMAPSLASASLQVSQVGSLPVGWRVTAPLAVSPVDPKQVRTLSANDKVAVFGEYRLQVLAVSTSENYTAVKYRLTGSWGNGIAQRIGLKVDGKWVPWRNTWSTPEPTGATEEAIFDALPPGAGSATVVVSPSGFRTAEILVNQSGSIPDGVARLGDWRRDGPTLEAPLQVSDPHAILDNAGYLLDAQNRRFAVIIMTDPDGKLIVRGWESVSGFEPVALVTSVTRYVPGPELMIDFGAGGP